MCMACVCKELYMYHTSIVKYVPTAQNSGRQEFGKKNVIGQHFTQPNSIFTKVANVSYCKFINIFLTKTLKQLIDLPKFYPTRILCYTYVHYYLKYCCQFVRNIHTNSPKWELSGIEAPRLSPRAVYFILISVLLYFTFEEVLTK